MLWGKRLRRAKSDVRVSGIIQRSVSGAIKGNPHLHSRESILRGVQLPSGEKLDTLTRVHPQRHPRETEVQYQLRTGVSNTQSRGKSNVEVGNNNQDKENSSYSRTSQLVSQCYRGAKTRRGIEQGDRAQIILAKFIRDYRRKLKQGRSVPEWASTHSKTHNSDRASGQVPAGPRLTAIEAMAMHHLRRERQAHHAKSRRAIWVLKPLIMCFRRKSSPRSSLRL